MDGPLIVYLHGFGSSPASWKSRLLAAEMARRGLASHFVCPVLPTIPDEAFASAAKIIEAAQGPVTLIGSSLGGHYATCLAEKFGLRAALINPAVVGRMDLAPFVGEHANFHSGERFHFSEAHTEQLRAQVSPPTPAHYWVLLETGDEVLDYRLAIDFYAGCKMTILPGGNHSFTQFPEFMTQLIEFAGL